MANIDEERAPLLKVFDDARVAEEKAASLYAEAAGLFSHLQKERGVSVEGTLSRYMPLIKKYAPMLLAGGGGTALTALVADSGAFSGIVNGLMTALGISAG